LNLDFVAPDLDFVSSGLDFVAESLDFVARDLEIRHRWRVCLMSVLGSAIMGRRRAEPS
jgi:hypothetical protein